MVKRSRKKPEPAKLYRHFAVITLAVTAAVAFMVDPASERKLEKAVTTAEAKSDQASREFKRASREQFGTGQLVDASESREVEGEFGSDSWVGFAGNGVSSSRPAYRYAPGAEPWVLLGMTREEFEALSRDEQAELLETLPGYGIDGATMARISRESMERAGRTEPSDDAPD